MGVDAAAIGMGFEGGIFGDGRAGGVTGVVEEAHGADVDEAFDAVADAGIDDVAGTPDGTGLKLFFTAFHGSTEVVDDFDARDGAVDGIGFAETAIDGVEAVGGGAGGGGLAEQEAGLFPIFFEAAQESAAEKAIGAGD